MVKEVFILLLCFADFTRAVFKVTPVDTLVILGESAQLNCSYKTFLENAAWFRVSGTDREAVTHRRAPVDSDSHYEIVGDEDELEYNLRIWNVTIKDERAYQCGNLLKPDNSSEAHLYVLNQSPFCTVHPNRIHIEGDEVVLNCTIDLDPSAPGELVWFQDGQEMHSENGAINVWEKKLTKEDNNGTFDCQLQHKTLPRWKWSMLSCEEKVILNVQYGPHVSISGSQTKIMEGDTYNAKCTVIDANPDEILLTRWIGPHGKIIADIATLLLKNVTREQRGDYTCVMVNEFYNGENGNGTASIMVDVQYLSKLALTVSPPINTTENDEIIINCTVLDGNPKPYELRLSLEGNVIADDSEPSLQYLIPSAKASDSGTYRCQASTLFYNGVEEYSLTEYTIVVRYSPTITIANTRVTADIGDTVELECSVNSLPPSVVSWYDPGNEVISNKDDRDEDNTVRSKVTITIEDESHYGKYTCHADNGIPPIARQTIELAKPVSSSTVVIAVGVAGGGLLVILLFVLIFCCYRQRSNKISKDNIDGSNHSGKNKEDSDPRPEPEGLSRNVDINPYADSADLLVPMSAMTKTGVENVNKIRENESKPEDISALYAVSSKQQRAKDVKQQIYDTGDAKVLYAMPDKTRKVQKGDLNYADLDLSSSESGRHAVFSPTEKTVYADIRPGQV